MGGNKKKLANKNETSKFSDVKQLFGELVETITSEAWKYYLSHICY